MPEGDTIHRAAQTLHRVLAGKIVTRFTSVFPSLTRVADDRPIVGRRIERVAARGKHLLMTFSGGLTLRTHMRMNGSWHIYPAGTRWRRPARDMRIVVATADAEAVGFNVPVAEWLTQRQLARHSALGALGPDLLDLEFNRAEAIRRVRAAAAAIADALLDQRVVAGIGNVLKSETLFVAGVNPFVPVAQIADESIGRILDVARDLLRVNVMTREQTLSVAVGRRTTRSLDPAVKLWVYGRGGQPCRRCGTPVRVDRRGVDVRLTYWCPQCQPL